jgi:hypothetical protein
MFKSIIYLVAICMLAVSCKTPYTTGTFKPDEPFVKLKTGQTFEGEAVKKQERIFASSKIEIDGKTYKAKDVSMYSNGRNTYANLSRNNYGEKVFGNDINVFRTISLETTTNSSGGSSTSTRIRDYIQYKDGKDYEYKLLSYKRLKELIPADGAAGDHLKKYKTNRMAARIAGLGGLALFVAGTGIMMSSLVAENSPTAGLVILGIGAGGVVASMPISYAGRHHIYDAVDIHNQQVAKSK